MTRGSAESAQTKQIRARLFAWLFEKRTGGKPNWSENTYAQNLAAQAELGSKAASKCKKWKRPDSPQPSTRPNLARLAAWLTAGGDEAARRHCLWELCQAFQRPEPNALFDEQLDSKRCNLRNAFSLQTAVSGVATRQAQPATGLEFPPRELVNLVAERVHLCADSLWQVLATTAGVQVEGQREQDDSDSLVRRFADLQDASGQPVAVNRLLSLLPKLQLPAAVLSNAASIDALHALFQLCLTHFAIKSLPGDLQAQDGVAQLAERNLVALSLVNEAWRCGLVRFELTAGDASAPRTAKPSHYVELPPVTLPGLALQSHVRELAHRLNHAADHVLDDQRMKGRLRATVDTARSDGIYWCAVLHGNTANRAEMVEQAATLFQALTLPVVVTTEPQTAGLLELPETPDFLEQKVLTYLDRLHDLITKSAK